MKRGFAFLVLAALTLVLPNLAYSQTTDKSYPTRQVRIVVPYPAGGPADLIARILAQKLGERLGKSFFVENVNGASGAVGAGQVAQAAPDGYTLLVVTNDFAVASVTNTNLPYDPVKNFTPVSIVAASPQVVAANPSFPGKTMKELISVVSTAPEKYSYASLGIGFGQLSAERLFKLGLKLDKLVRVPFNGAAPAVNSTLAGDTQIMFLGLPPVAPHLQSEKLRAIAVTSHARASQFPNVPTLDEAGIPNQESELQIGMVAPTGTPPNVIATLHDEIAQIVRLPDIKSTLDTVSFHGVASSPAEFAAQIKDDIAVWGKVMKDAGIPVN
ncbi:MAG TPA: tripartite tricarboxylate transporter substrate-binding protein [Xanthobacteraceae bacterium]|nr:tripartite tricarboxylate transporter substrate-binding protein [Xanthobacteraceae bacterium]